MARRATPAVRAAVVAGMASWRGLAHAARVCSACMTMRAGTPTRRARRHVAQHHAHGANPGAVVDPDVAKHLGDVKLDRTSHASRG